MQGEKSHLHRINQYHWIGIALTLAALMWGVAGCDIEEAEPPTEGAVHVSLSDDAGNELIGARIHVDGEYTSQFTPSIVGGLSAGIHDVGAFLSGYIDTVSRVDVLAGDTIDVPLVTLTAPFGAFLLDDVPDGTHLLLNNVTRAITPPLLIPEIGIGDYQVSAFLNGHATDLPAMWTITLNPGDTTTISPHFTELSCGSTTGDLAPLFTLPDDRDSSLYSLHNYRGKVLLISFFFYTCTFCILEFPDIQAVYEDPDYAGYIEFFGIDPVDPWEVFGSFREDHSTLGLTFPLLHNGVSSGFDLQTDYDVSIYPANFIIDQTGKIRYRMGSVTEEIVRNAVETLLSEANQ